MTDSDFHLQPGDTCRLLDGPLMIYAGIEEHDGTMHHVFGFWRTQPALGEEAPAFLSICFSPMVLKLIRRVDN